MPAKHLTKTYLVGYFTPGQCLQAPEERGFPKNVRVLATDAVRALNKAYKEILGEDGPFPGSSKADISITEVKVVA